MRRYHCALVLACSALMFAAQSTEPLTAGGGSGDAACQQLWMQRNSIFAKNGYCFTSEEAKAVFGEGCFAPFGKLSAADQAQVDQIKSKEAAHGCDGGGLHASGPATRPVMYGRDPELDACSSTGVIVGLKSNGDAFLSVRSSPGGDEIGRLRNGQLVNICDGADGWLGIVYDAAGQNNDSCNVAISLKQPMPYPGPCQSGWVSERYVKQVSG